MKSLAHDAPANANITGRRRKRKRPRANSDAERWYGDPRRCLRPPDAEPPDGTRRLTPIELVELGVDAYRRTQPTNRHPHARRAAWRGVFVLQVVTQLPPDRYGEAPAHVGWGAGIALQVARLYLGLLVGSKDKYIEAELNDEPASAVAARRARYLCPKSEKDARHLKRFIDGRVSKATGNRRGGLTSEIERVRNLVEIGESMVSGVRVRKCEAESLRRFGNTSIAYAVHCTFIASTGQERGAPHRGALTLGSLIVGAELEVPKKGPNVRAYYVTTETAAAVRPDRATETAARATETAVSTATETAAAPRPRPRPVRPRPQQETTGSYVPPTYAASPNGEAAPLASLAVCENDSTLAATATPSEVSPCQVSAPESPPPSEDSPRHAEASSVVTTPRHHAGASATDTPLRGSLSPIAQDAAGSAARLGPPARDAMPRHRTHALTRSDPGGLWSLTLRAAADALVVYVECDELAQAEAMAPRLARGGSYTVARHGTHGAVVEIHPAPGDCLEELAEVAAERLERWSLVGLAWWQTHRVPVRVRARLGRPC